MVFRESCVQTTEILRCLESLRSTIVENELSIFIHPQPIIKLRQLSFILTTMINHRYFAQYVFPRYVRSDDALL